MFRVWPDQAGPESVIIRYPKKASIANAIVTGIFFLFGALCLSLAFYKYLVAGWTIDKFTALGMIILIIFVSGVGLLMVLNLRNIIKEGKIRLLASRDGLFLDIVAKGDRAFYLRWEDIEKVEFKTPSDPFWGSGGFKTKGEVLSIAISEKAGETLPAVVKNARASKREIQINSYTLDRPLYEIVKKLRQMKERFE